MPRDDVIRMRHMVGAAENAQQFPVGRQRSDLDFHTLLPASKASLRAASLPWAQRVAMRISAGPALPRK